MTDSDYSVKHKRLIQTGKALFFKYGIKRVSVAEICKEAGVSKMTFYKHYANKGELAKEFLLEMNEAGMKEYRELMAQDISFSEKVKQIIQNKVRDTEGISKEFIKDIFADPKLGLLKVMEKQAQEGLNALLNDFKAAAERGEIRKGIKPEFITYFLEKTRQMITDEKLSALYDSEQELIIELTNFFFYGLGIKNE